MKETVNVSIASHAFTIDRDAYELLESYLHEVKSRLDRGEEDETYSDIEARIAEIFREKLPSPMMVITISIVRETMAQMGTPNDFGTPRNESCEGDNNTFTNIKTLRRSKSDRMIAGICGGVAKYMGIDATVVRLAAVILIFIMGVSLWLYILLWILIPEADNNHKIK